MTEKSIEATCFYAKNLNAKFLSQKVMYFQRLHKNLNHIDLVFEI